MGDVKMVLLGDTNVARPDPDSAFAPAMNLLKDADIRVSYATVTAISSSTLTVTVGSPAPVELCVYVV